jgi:hypothetical protein
MLKNENVACDGFVLGKMHRVNSPLILIRKREMC